VKCWEVSTGYCTRTFSGHSDWVRCLSISLDGELLASAGSDQTVIIWKLSTGQPLQTLRGHEHVIECVSFGKKSVVAQLLDAKSSGDSVPDGTSVSLFITNNLLYKHHTNKLKLILSGR
jgi:WD40 repeat protein